MSNSRVGSFLFAFLLLTTAASAQVIDAPSKSAIPPTSVSNDMVHLDVVVAPKSGPPLSDLQQQDFTVLDNKKERPINSFHAVRGRDVDLHIIIVIDDVNTGVEHIAYERSELDKFLKMDAGRLPYPVGFAYLTDTNFTLPDSYSTDGNALSASVASTFVGLHSILRSGGIYSAEERFEASLKALDQLATREASVPGRKFVIWLSPGWPILSGPGVQEQLDNKQRQEIFNSVVSFSNLLRNARITLYSVDPLGTADFGTNAFWWQEYAGGVNKAYDANMGNLALQVLAVQSGGMALLVSNDIAAEVRRCVNDADAYYELTFVPPLDQKPNELNKVQVRVNKRDVDVRARQVYYWQP
ncbi:MAG TPA: VWA domain-containing protein [Candidatus Sulfotelmatobacter sp.]|nr:VWA domain-containing protein [Candidatus Sulfotelmatobacter sp.]